MYLENSLFSRILDGSLRTCRKLKDAVVSSVWRLIKSYRYWQLQDIIFAHQYLFLWEQLYFTNPIALKLRVDDMVLKENTTNILHLM